MEKRVIGIDVGGVIIDRVNNDKTDTSFHSENYLLTTAVEGVFEAIKRVVECFGAENVYIVSKCGKKVEEKTKKWLIHHDFYRLTGVKDENVHFCRDRRDKAPICVKLGITHFIDDRLQVLGFLVEEGIFNLYLFQHSLKEVGENRGYASRVTFVYTWDEVLSHLL